MESPLRPSAIPAWELAGVRALLDAPRPTPQLGLDWALAVFCTFAAPPAVMVAGLLHPGAWPVLFWLAACGFLFAGLGMASRLEPLPPRPVLETRRPRARRPAAPEIERRTIFPEPRRDGLDGIFTPELPGIEIAMSRSEILERLAKLRERGDLSGREYLRARRRLGAD